MVFRQRQKFALSVASPRAPARRKQNFQSVRHANQAFRCRNLLIHAEDSPGRVLRFRHPAAKKSCRPQIGDAAMQCLLLTPLHAKNFRGDESIRRNHLRFYRRHRRHHDGSAVPVHSRRFVPTNDWGAHQGRRLNQSRSCRVRSPAHTGPGR